MRLKNLTLASTVLLMLVFTIGMASATDQNATGNETPTVNTTGTADATLTATATATSTAIAGATDNETADEGIIGPGNALYGLKIAFENIGETFTFNASEKLGKQVAHARQRIAEARAELGKNDTEAANRALAEYGAKINAVNESMSKLSDNDTGLINAQQMITKHQDILGMLLASHPNSTGLLRAYNNSIRLEEKFKLKIERRAGRIENNRTETKAGHNESVNIQGNKSEVKGRSEKKTGSREKQT